MPTFHIELDDGRKFEIDADNQQSALSAIPHIQAAPQLDQYHQRARDVINEQAAKGRDISGGYLDKYLKGATMGFGDELVAGLRTGLGAVVDPLRHIGDANYKGVPIAERYKYEKALEDERAKDADRKTGVFGTVAELAGGLGTGIGAARNGLTLIREGQQLLPRIGAAAAEGAGYGAVSGAGEGDGLKDRLQKAATGALAGGTIGGALPAAGAIAKTVAAPALSNITARVDPVGYAKSLVARGLDRSGMSADDVAQRLEQARLEGQGNYQLADVNPAFQRLTAGFMKAPGQAKTLGAEMLERRQANQGAELRSNIRHALDAPITADEMNTGMRQIRSDDANRLYGLVDADAGNVDVTPALNAADRFLGTGAARDLPVGTTLPDDSVEGIVRRARGLLGTNEGDQVFDFQTALRRKRDLDSMIDSANPTQQAQLIPIRDALDQQLERASGHYANARNTYRQQSQVIEGIGEGQRAARAGLPEDTIPAFNRMERDPQSAFRVGYADTLMNDLGGAPGVNKARNLTGDYVQQELNAIAVPGRAPRLLRQIERSSEMNRTRNLANGGSATAENLADAADAAVDPRLFSQLMQGNVMGAISSLGTGLGNAATGNTEAVRNEALRILLGVNPGAQPSSAALNLLRRLGFASENRASPRDFRGMLAELQKSTRRRQSTEASALRGLLSMSGQQAGAAQ